MTKLEKQKEKLEKGNAGAAPQPSDFRFFLQKLLAERLEANPQYSLRAMAKSFKVSPSTLSEVLSGKKKFSKRLTRVLAEKLDLSPDQIAHFESRAGRKKRRTPLADSQSIDFQQLTLDQFAVISDWYHYAILELLKTQGFNQNPAWIARRLGVSTMEVAAAVERLIRIGLIELDSDGNWLDTSNGFSTNLMPNTTTVGTRKLQKQVLRQSLEALDEVEPHLRDHTSMTMAIHPDDLGEAKAMIKKFRRELCQFLERRKDVTEVYQLSVGLFPSTKPQNKKRKLENEK